MTESASFCFYDFSHVIKCLVTDRSYLFFVCMFFKTNWCRLVRDYRDIKNINVYVSDGFGFGPLGLLPLRHFVLSKALNCPIPITVFVDLLKWSNKNERKIRKACHFLSRAPGNLTKVILQAVNIQNYDVFL